MNLEPIILEMNSKLSEVYTIVCSNGLVSSVKKQAGDIAQIREEIGDIKRSVYRSDADRLEGCPYKKEVEATRETIDSRRRNKFDTRLVIYGLIIGGLSMVPQIIRLFLE